MVKSNYYYCLLAAESGYKGFYHVQIKSDFIFLLTFEQSFYWSYFQLGRPKLMWYCVAFKKMNQSLKSCIVLMIWYGTSQVALVVKKPTCQFRRHKRHGFDPWVGKIPWRRAQQLTPVFLPGDSHGQRSLAGNSPQGRKESDMTEPLSTHSQDKRREVHRTAWWKLRSCCFWQTLLHSISLTWGWPNPADARG